MSFSWKNFFNELFLKVVNEYDAKSLAKVAYEIFPEKSLMDRDADGREFRLEELDPCTFLARFNRKESNVNRIAYCEKAKDVLHLQSEVPIDFDGIPIFRPVAYWFFAFKWKRIGNEFQILWDFSQSLARSELQDKQFNDALKCRGVGRMKLTTVCYIVWPDKYLPLDERTLRYLRARDPGISQEILNNPQFAAYQSFLERVKKLIPDKTFAEISHSAYLETREQWDDESFDDDIDEEIERNYGCNFWLAGAIWGAGKTREEKTEEFLREGVWKNGYSEDSGDKSVENVKRAKPGDYIAIKSASTKGPDRKTSFLKIKAIGVITENPGDGVNLKVDWKYRGPSFDIDNYSYRQTFTRVGKLKIVEKIFGRFLGSRTGVQHSSKARTKDEFDTSKPRNIIYWGPPGTGKTYKLLKLKEQFEDIDPSNTVDQIVQWSQDKTWWEVLAAAMIDVNKPITIPELFEHKFVQIKWKQSSGRTPLETIWGTLQAHTVRESKTVNVERRAEPLFVDKTEDSRWYLTNNWEEQLKDIVLDVNRFRNRKIGQNRRYEIVTFHQSYSYEEFVEGLRPVIDEDGVTIRYEVRPGVFRRICERAEQDPNNPYAIFIDEINRGNISRIFGELITLIEPDKRLGQLNEIKVKLPYSRIEFGVPSNVHIIGTMNSVDRSIALVDMALRRRFEFVNIRPNETLIDPEVIDGVNIRRVFRNLNEKISAILGSEYQIGHSYFMGDRVANVHALKATWFGSILPLLQEYFFDDWSKLKAILGGFVIEKAVSGLESLPIARKSYGSFVDEDMPNERFIELMKALE